MKYQLPSSAFATAASSCHEIDFAKAVSCELALFVGDDKRAANHETGGQELLILLDQIFVSVPNLRAIRTESGTTFAYNQGLDGHVVRNEISTNQRLQLYHKND